MNIDAYIKTLDNRHYMPERRDDDDDDLNGNGFMDSKPQTSF